MTPSPLTTVPYGATPIEWDWAAYNFGADLLPAVGDPVFKVSSESALKDHKSLAKTPSVTGSNGLSYGIKGWAAHQATYEIVQRWKADPSLNILLSTRNVRAIDIDIADSAIAEQMENYIVGSLGATSLPVRFRNGTGKRTLLIRLNPHVPIRKRVIKTAHGAIEFLADGQQTALLGTHPDGSRFQLRGHENGIPTVSLERMVLLWDALRKAYNPHNKKPLVDPEEQAGEFIVRNGGALASDPVLQFLEAEGWVVSYESNGTANVRCPNEAQHSEGSGANSTVWLPEGLGGKKHGGFRCLHGHCEHIDTGVFLGLIGFHRKEAETVFTQTAEEHPAVQEQRKIQALESMGTLDSTQQNQLELAHYRQAAAMEANGKGWLTDGKGKKKPGQANVNVFCRSQPDVLRVKKDLFKEELMIQMGSDTAWKPVSDVIVTYLQEVAQRDFDFSPSATELSSALALTGEQFKYDSAVQWLQQQRHDGVKRIATFHTDILGAVDSEYGVALSHYLWVAMAARVLEPGVKADMAVIFVSPRQGTGKSSLVRALAPFDEWYAEFDLGTRDEDGSRLLRGKVVVELPELKGLASRDAESIKAWLTKQVEEWTPKYKEYAVRYPRRCIFIGTDNRQRFLSDPSGNRRFLPLRVAVHHEHINWPALVAVREQYWAEALAVIAQFSSPAAAVEHFSYKVNALADPARLAATIIDESFDEARMFLAQQAPGTRVTINALKSQLRMTGNHDHYRCYSILRMLGWEQVDGTNQWVLPTPKIIL